MFLYPSIFASLTSLSVPSLLLRLLDSYVICKWSACFFHSRCWHFEWPLSLTQNGKTDTTKYSFYYEYSIFAEKQCCSTYPKYSVQKLQLIEFMRKNVHKNISRFDEIAKHESQNRESQHFCQSVDWIKSFYYLLFSFP